jgi:DNA repair exonuclease SbcCD ATPase subunit
MDLESLDKDIATLKRAIILKKQEKSKKVCDTCGSKLSKEAKQVRNARVLEVITDMEEQIRNFEGDKRRVKAKLETLNTFNNGEPISEYENLLEELDQHIAGINEVAEQNKEIEEAKRLYRSLRLNPPTNLKEKKAKVKEAMLAHFEEAKKLKARYGELKGGLRKLEKKVAALRWVTDVALSNKGLKNYILSELIERLNTLLESYTEATGFLARFEIEMDKASKGVRCIVYQGDYERRYEDLSGGQRQLVNVCVAFALNDLYSDLNPCTLLFLDEVFESLSRNNIDIVVDIVKSKAKNKSVHLITHREEFMVSHSKILQLPIRMR